MPKKIPKTIREDIKTFVLNEIINGKISKVNMRYIAKSLDIGTGTIYNYFSSKEDIYFEIAKEHWEQKVVSKINNVTGNSFKDKLINVMCIFHEFHTSMEIMTNRIDEKDKYYLFFTLFKRMNDISHESIIDTIQTILIEEKIEFNELQIKMISDFIRISRTYSDTDYKVLAEYLCKILM